MRPWVVLNAGITLDGKIASRTRDSKISCPEDLKRVHELRTEVDGIMVGINTALIDDPKLTAHKVPGGRNPVRIVVDSCARIPLTAQVFKGETRTIIAVSKKAPEEKLMKVRKKAEVIVCGDVRVDLRCLMRELYTRGIKKLLLEGGGTLNWGMLEEKLVDEVRVAIAPKIVGGREAISLVEGKGFNLVAEGVKLRLKKSYPLGEDLILEYEVVR
jgi:2,5-diamino-6-(ribosylamino)-4(3H)-pyrimidinone 5'-phosphate reductase